MFEYPKIPNLYDNIDLSKFINNQTDFDFFEDGQSPIEIMQRQEEYLRNTVPALQQIANSSKVQSDLALEKSKKADVKGLIAIIISIGTFLIEIIVNRNEIANFIIEMLQSIQ